MSVIVLAPARTDAPVKFRTLNRPESTSEVNVQPFVWESDTLEFADRVSVEALQCASPVTVIPVVVPADAIASRTPLPQAIFASAPTWYSRSTDRGGDALVIRHVVPPTVIERAFRVFTGPVAVHFGRAAETVADSVNPAARSTVSPARRMR